MTTREGIATRIVLDRSLVSILNESNLLRFFFSVGWSGIRGVDDEDASDDDDEVVRLSVRLSVRPFRKPTNQPRAPSRSSWFSLSFRNKSPD